jgi:hypothetical protein
MNSKLYDSCILPIEVEFGIQSNREKLEVAKYDADLVT